MKAHFSNAIRPLTQLARFVRPVSSSYIVLALGLGLSDSAHAVDGCKLLLCMAGNWQNISQCTPTVRQALRDVARGRAWPTCTMAGNNASGNQFVAPAQCPEQYRTMSTDWRDRVVYSCPFSGVIHIAVEGQPWSRTWWSPSGDSVVEWLPAAKAALANSPDAMDAQFDRDHAAWTISEQGRLTSEPDAAAANSQGSGW